ncbi:hypothetical protein CVT24_001002 [Panaeolus cyanescens]|uniref:Uncharacterized protein n=1 Tax=Panaeolus cyanescens TaxID=181874 RepID=A0A409YCJ9_9AGAR|nr:hypothetical protein CVT24_001002 [Panaeolus cyanescens]
MFKLSIAFVSALLYGVAYGSPAVQNTVCSPSAIDTTAKFFIKSAAATSLVWQAEDVSSDNFIFVDLQTQANGSNDQLWSVIPNSNSNSFSFVSAGVASANICANGDGGPLDSAACPDIISARQAPQFATWSVSCQSCASNGATGCQFQAVLEGQCADFLDDTDTTVKLDDCATNQPNQLWDIVASA